jgi:hypothetical protein
MARKRRVSEGAKPPFPTSRQGRDEGINAQPGQTIIDEITFEDKVLRAVVMNDEYKKVISRVFLLKLTDPPGCSDRKTFLPGVQRQKKKKVRQMK